MNYHETDKLQFHIIFRDVYQNTHWQSWACTAHLVIIFI